MNTNNIKSFISKHYNNDKSVNNISDFINKKDENGNTPVMLAVLFRELSFKELVCLVNSENINELSNFNDSVFSFACRLKPKFAYYLYNEYSQLKFNHNKQYKLNVLFSICELENKYSKYLFDKIIENFGPEDINQKSELTGNTILMSVAEGQLHYFSSLINQGADIYIKNLEGKGVENSCKEFIKRTKSKIRRDDAKQILKLIKSIKEKDSLEKKLSYSKIKTKKVL